MRVHIGCCGFALRMEEYFKRFSTIELQSTFYKLPKAETAKKWRELAPNDFIFNVKAFQGITHPVTSPTWRRSGVKLTGEEKFGLLQPSKEVFDSWEKTLEICNILKATICLIQLPTSFKDSKGNLENAERFFSKIRRNGLEIAVELRGWSEKNIENLCKKFNLIHCTDPFASIPTYFGKAKIGYFRLHGKPPGKQLYKYKYTRNDLLKLKEKIESLPVEEVFILFNNIYMKDDALHFKKMLKS